MTEVATGETPADLPPIPPMPELAAEVETAPDAVSPEAAEPVAVAPTETIDQAAVPEGEAPAPAPELAYQNSSTSAAILEHFADSAEGGDQTIAQIIAGLGGTVSRNTIESAVRRLHEAGRLLRVSPGTYRLAPPPPPEPSKLASSPQPEPVRSGGMSEAAWMDALEAWLVESSTWNVDELGPPPTDLTNRIPHAVKVKMNDRLRKKEARAKDREAAVARQAEADAALRAKLIAGCFNNVTLGAGIQDMAPVRQMLADGVPLEHVLIGLKRRCDRRIDPQALPLASWREEKFLVEVARAVLLGGLLPKLVAGWAAAGTAPQKPVERAEASPAVPAPPDHEDTPALSTGNGGVPSGDAAELGPSAAALIRKFGQANGTPSPEAPPAAPVVEGRDDVRAAFAGNRTPQPATPQPPRPAERPWFAGPEAPEPKGDMSDEGWRFVLEGYVARTVAWVAKYGPPPGDRNCRVPPRILREFGL
jgi:hypothetical protein